MCQANGLQNQIFSLRAWQKECFPGRMDESISGSPPNPKLCQARAHPFSTGNDKGDLSSQLQPLFLGCEGPWQVAACQCHSYGSYGAPLHSSTCAIKIHKTTRCSWFMMAYGPPARNGNANSIMATISNFLPCQICWTRQFAYIDCP